MIDIRTILGDDDGVMAALHDHIRQRNMQLMPAIEVALPAQAPPPADQTGDDDAAEGGQLAAAESAADGEGEGEAGRRATLMLTPYNELDDGRFLEPDSGAVVAINHFNLVSVPPRQRLHTRAHTRAHSRGPLCNAQEVESVAPPSLADGTDKVRLALKAALEAYLKKSLPRAGRCQVYCCGGGASEEGEAPHRQYVLVIVGELFQTKNMRNGQWRSIWTLSPGSGAAPHTALSGEIDAVVHYFEDGNVQLCASRSCKDVPCKVADDEADDEADGEAAARRLASAVIAAIKSKEDDVQLAINEAYSQLADGTFKRLRRQLPVTRSKVDWYDLHPIGHLSSLS